MIAYKLKDKYGNDFIISRVSDNEYRIRFTHHVYNREYIGVYTRDQLRLKTQKAGSVFRNELLKCFSMGIFDKLTPSTDYDDAMKYILLVIESFSGLTQTIRDGKIVYELSEVDGNLLRMRLQKLGQVLGVEDAETYRRLYNSEDNIKNNTISNDSDGIFTGHYNDIIDDIDLEG